MGHATRTTKLLLNLDRRDQGRANSQKRADLAATTAEWKYRVVQTIAEYASSLHEKRGGMKKQLVPVELQAVAVVLIAYPDRLVGFGLSSLQEAFRGPQVCIEVLDPPAQVDPITDLRADRLTIATVFCGIFYAHRAHANPRRSKALPLLVSKSEREGRAA